MKLSSLSWIKVITDEDCNKWAYTRQRLKELDNCIDANEFTIFPLGFKDETACKPERENLIALIQKGKLTHIVEVLDEDPYTTTDWFFRFVRVWWWKPTLEWEYLPSQSDLLGFDPGIRDGKPHLIVNLNRYRERWENDGKFEGFKQYLTKNLSQFSRS